MKVDIFNNCSHRRIKFEQFLLIALKMNTTNLNPSPSQCCFCMDSKRYLAIFLFLEYNLGKRAGNEDVYSSFASTNWLKIVILGMLLIRKVAEEQANKQTNKQRNE